MTLPHSQRSLPEFQVLNPENVPQDNELLLIQSYILPLSPKYNPKDILQAHVKQAQATAVVT